MPQQRMDIRMIKDILRLKYQGGLSHERIARSLSISKGVVAKYLGLAGAAGLDWAATAELDEAALERRLLGRSAAEDTIGRSRLRPCAHRTAPQGRDADAAVGRVPRRP